VQRQPQSSRQDDLVKLLGVPYHEAAPRLRELEERFAEDIPANCCSTSLSWLTDRMIRGARKRGGAWFGQ
jgi:hypothetical protein